MGWYVLQCRPGIEEKIIHSCKRNLSRDTLEDAFVFQSERLWRTSGGCWKLIVKEMFPGYVFLQSSNPRQLSEELEEYRKIVKVLEEPGYLISVYKEEEEYLRKICGDSHYMKLTYGYKENGINHFVEGPLKGIENQIIKADWHHRFAQLVIPVAQKNVIIWAGLGLVREKMVS